MTPRRNWRWPIRVLMGALSLWMGGSPNAPAQDAVALGTEAGFEISTDHLVIPAPPGLVGHRIVDTSIRAGKLPENEGTRTRHILTIGSFVAKCPTASGVVEGNFVYEMRFDQVIEENGRQKTLHVAHTISGALKGQTGDDALLDQVEIDASLTLERRGTDQEELVRRSRIQATFLPDRRTGGLPTKISVGSASPWDVPDDSVASGEQGGALFAAAILFSGQTYFVAETGWRAPNTCVELKFTPPSLSRSLVPGNRTNVLAEVRTLDGGAAVAGRFVLEELRSGNGEVTPKRTESTIENPAQITYLAPQANVAGSGFHADAWSRAGTAAADWQLLNAFTLEFEDHIWDDRTSMSARAGYALFDATIRFTVTLEPWVGGRLRGEAVGQRKLAVGHISNQCRGSGAWDEHWLVLGDYDAASKVLNLHFGSTSHNEHATWTCSGPGGGGPRNLLVARVSAEINEALVSTLTGSAQRVTKNVGGGQHEELVVKVIASPAR